MSIVIELPPELEKEISGEAGRGGITPADQAALILCLAGALLGEAHDTPFRGAVRSFLARHQIDPGQLSSALDQIKDLCLEVGPDVAIERSTDRDRLGVLLRGWRDAAVHRRIDGPSTPRVATPPEAAPDRPRPSILGKYAYLGLSSEDHAREKQMEIDREDRKSWP